MTNLEKVLCRNIVMRILEKYPRIYLIGAVLAFLVLTQSLWNSYMTFDFFIALKGGFKNALGEIIYPGLVGIMLCILYIIGYFRNWYWVVIAMLLFSIEQTHYMVPLLPYLGNFLAGTTFWNTVLSTYFLLYLFLVNFILFIFMSLYKYREFRKKKISCRCCLL